MRPIYIAILLCIVSLSMSAQSSNFEDAYNACVKINDGFSGGFANAEQLAEAAKTLRDLKIQSLKLSCVKGVNKPMDDHIVFSADHIDKLIKKQKIYEKAEEFDRNSYSRTIGSIVYMSTVVIPAGETYTYEIDGCDYASAIGCVAETNGLMSWTVTAVEERTGAIEKYFDNKNEKTGRTARRMVINRYRPYKLLLEITNTSLFESSFAVLYNRSK